MRCRYLIRTADVPAYHPANHEHTSNQRLIGPDNVGARQLEVVLGTIARGGGALAHAHPGIEQVCHLLEGSAHVEIGAESFEMAAGDSCFFPADTLHVFKVTSAQPARVLVIYAPPYGEDPNNVVRPRAEG